MKLSIQNWSVETRNAISDATEVMAQKTRFAPMMPRILAMMNTGRCTGLERNTFRESLREPIYLLMTLSALVLMGFFPVLTLYVFSAQEKLVIDSAMATMMVFGWGLAIMISSYAISREIDNGTAPAPILSESQHPGRGCIKSVV